MEVTVFLCPFCPLRVEVRVFLNSTLSIQYVMVVRVFLMPVISSTCGSKSLLYCSVNKYINRILRSHNIYARILRHLTISIRTGLSEAAMFPYDLSV